MRFRFHSPVVRSRPSELGPRFGIAVSHHAVAQARERYDGSLVPFDILEDVVAAMRAERIGDSVRRARIVWTEDRSRVYVVGHRKRTLVVVTALPPQSKKASRVLHRHGLPAVGAALVAAGIGGGEL